MKSGYCEIMGDESLCLLSLNKFCNFCISVLFTVLQEGNECSCGNQLRQNEGLFPKRPDTECDYKCVLGGYCGGEKRTSVYKFTMV